MKFKVELSQNLINQIFIETGESVSKERFIEEETTAAQRKALLASPAWKTTEQKEVVFHLNHIGFKVDSFENVLEKFFSHAEECRKEADEKKQQAEAEKAAVLQANRDKYLNNFEVQLPSWHNRGTWDNIAGFDSETIEFLKHRFAAEKAAKEKEAAAAALEYNIKSESWIKEHGSEELKLRLELGYEVTDLFPNEYIQVLFAEYGEGNVSEYDSSEWDLDSVTKPSLELMKMEKELVSKFPNISVQGIYKSGTRRYFIFRLNNPFQKGCIDTILRVK